jgi:hypothetical protein
LRVLSQETLEARKEVKDPSIPGPSLAKDVHDPSLTILLRHRYSSISNWRLRRRSEVFSSSGAHLQEKEVSIFSREAISTISSYTEFIASVIAPFCSHFLGVFSAIRFVVAWAKFLKERTHFL